MARRTRKVAKNNNKPKDTEKAKLRCFPYTCPKCGYRVEYRPCFICETRRSADHVERTYLGSPDDANGFGLLPEEEARRQEVLRRPPVRLSSNRFVKPDPDEDADE